MTTSESLALLGLDHPQIKGATQEDVDAKLQAWKENELKAAYRVKAKETHPDRNPDDPDAAEKLKAVRAAYEKLLKLRSNLKRPDDRCPSGHERLPEQANYCHECGYCYVETPLVARLKAAGIVDHTIDAIRASGELAKYEAMNPLAEEMQQAIALLFHRQRLGLVGHRGWRS